MKRELDNPKVRRVRLRRGYSYLRRVRGRSRRVRVSVPARYATVTAEELRRARRVEVPAPKPAVKKARRKVPAPKPAVKKARRKVPAPKPVPKVTKKTPPSRRVLPKPLKKEVKSRKRPKLTDEQVMARRAQFVDKLKRKRKRLADVPKLTDAWTSAYDYQASVSSEAKAAGLPVDHIDSNIAHSNHLADWVHRDSLFIWPTKNIPKDAEAVTIGFDGKPVRLRESWHTVRIWFLVEHLENEKSMLWSVAGGLNSTQRLTWEEAFEYAQALYSQMIASLEDLPYLVVRGFVAWTGYFVGEDGHGGPLRGKDA